MTFITLAMMTVLCLLIPVALPVSAISAVILLYFFPQQTLALLVAIAVVGILAAIAMPFYNSYRNRAYEASAMGYMRSWPAAQELYRQQTGHYADADEQLDNPLDVVTDLAFGV